MAPCEALLGTAPEVGTLPKDVLDTVTDDECLEMLWPPVLLKKRWRPTLYIDHTASFNLSIVSKAFSSSHHQ
jgi:hypothetical protein